VVQSSVVQSSAGDAATLLTSCFDAVAPAARRGSAMQP
jgi:hypothetical protein